MGVADWTTRSVSITWDCHQRVNLPVNALSNLSFFLSLSLSHKLTAIHFKTAFSLCIGLAVRLVFGLAVGSFKCDT